MRASIIIVNHNGGPSAVRNISHIASAIGDGTELIVVDNDSTDGSAEAVERDVPPAIVIRSAENRGYAAGVDLGIEESRGDVVVVLNADVRPRDGALELLIDSASGDGGRRLVGGLVVDHRGKVSRNCRRALPRPVDILREALFLPPRARRVPFGEGLAETDVVSGSVMAVGRGALDELGPMDEDYFLYNEDVEWCRRAGEKGIPVLVEERAVFEHEGGASTRGDDARALTARVLADFQYFCENGEAPRELVRRLWLTRLLWRSLGYGAAALLPLARREVFRRRAAVCRLIRRALRDLEWRPAGPGAQNAHPLRLLDLPAPRPLRDPRPSVLVVLPDLDFGGAQRLVESTVTGPLRERYRFEILCLRELGGIGEDLRRRGVPVHVAGLRGWRSLRDWRLAADVCALFRPDIVHSHLLPGDVCAWLGFGRRVPRVSTELSVDGWVGPASREVERLALRGATEVVAVSNGVACAKSYLGPSGALPLVLESPAAVPYADSPAPLFCDDRPVTLAMVGRLHPVKRVDLFIRCAAALAARAPGRHVFRVVGEGRERPRLEELARGLGLAGELEFRGAVRDVAAELDEADIVLLLSDYEGLGLTVLETLARGRVPLVRRVAGAEETVPEGVAELLIDTEDPEVLAARVEELVADPGRCRGLVDAGRAWLCSRADRAAKLDQVYGDALQRNERKRVLHIITRLIVGGAQENTIASVERVDPTRFDSRLWIGPETGAEGSLLEDARRRGLNVRIIPRLVRRISPFDDLVSMWHMVRMLRRRRFDLVHTHSSKAGITGRVAARLAGVPAVVHTVHGWGFHEHMHPLLRGFYVWLERAMVPLSDRLVAVSHRTTDIGLTAAIGERSSYDMIRSGIPTARFHPDADVGRSVRRSLDIGEDDIVIGSVGRLSPQKNPADFVELARLVRERSERATFVYVGDGPMRDEIFQLAREKGVGEHIRFLGIRHDVPDLLRAFDIFVLTSLWEGLPRVIPQALATGVPVVAYNVSGIEEAIREGVNGHLVQPGAVRDAAQIVADLAIDDERRRAVSVRALETFDPAFTEDGMVESLETLYSSLLDV